MKNVIPKMTHPLSSAWRQPDMSNVLIDDTHAVMDEDTFDGLPEYSSSQPTGVYEGKCWKACNYSNVDKKWWLCWFDESPKPDCCSTNSREIILIEDP